MTVASGSTVQVLSEIIRQDLPPVSFIDSVVFGDHEWLGCDLTEQDDLRFRLVGEAFSWHCQQCPPYRDFARRLGTGPEDIRGPADLSRIPQLPTSVFKRHRLVSVPGEQLVLDFTSSGTSGRKSVVYRDSISLHRLCGMVQADSPLFSGCVDGLDETDSLILNLGLSRQDAGQVWFGYVMSLMEQFAPMRTYSDEDGFHAADAVRDWRDAVAAGRYTLVIGPPFLVADFCAAVRAAGGPAGRDAVLVFTGGGWKSRWPEQTSREQYTSRVVADLGLASAAQVRDVFNQVELNTLLVECAGHRKHVPPWVHVVTRDPQTFAPLPDGQQGVLSYCDATANSYPCFYVGDDLGRVDRGRCRCGRQAVTLEITRRLRGTTHAGCAETIRSALETTVDAPGT